MRNIKLAHYYERDSRQEEALLFRAGLGLQSAELNEMQSIAAQQMRRIGDHLLRNGAQLSGGAPLVDAQSGEVLCPAAEVYVHGRVRDVAEKRFSIAVQGVVHLGVWLQERVLTELEEPALRDPATGTLNYDERGAARLRLQLQWGSEDEALAAAFFKLYEVEDGVLKRSTPPPDVSGFAHALARYDRDNNGGHYVIEGLRLLHHSHDGQQEEYSLLEGKAHVAGYEVQLPTARRLHFPFDPDLQQIQSEPHQYRHHTDGMRIEVDRAPIARILKVNVTKQKEVQILHGSYAGAVDVLPDAAIIEIVSVQQNQSAYQQGSDWIFSGGALDWSPGGAEPAAGSSYQVVYKHIVQVEPEAADEYGFSVRDAVDGSLVLVDYQCRLPRVDTLCLDRDGHVHRIKGQSRRERPRAVAAPQGLLELAQLHHTWFQARPTEVHNTAITAVSMDSLQDMRADILSLYDLVALERLKTEAVATAPAATRGVFVDPFQNDSQRDLGQAQTAAIVDGVLTLPLQSQTFQLDESASVLSLPYRAVPLISQTARTGRMKINPYAAFDPIPATVELQPATDVWTAVESVNAATETRRFGAGHQEKIREFETRRTVGTQAAEFLRPLNIHFRIEGFKAREGLRKVIFDGVAIAVEEAS